MKMQAFAWCLSNMAYRRTRKDKIIARLRRRMQSTSPVERTASLPAIKIPEVSLAPERPVGGDESSAGFRSLFSYDPALIRLDLKRSLLLSGIAFGIEIVLYFGLR